MAFESDCIVHYYSRQAILTLLVIKLSYNVDLSIFSHCRRLGYQTKLTGETMGLASHLLYDTSKITSLRQRRESITNTLFPDIFQ